MNNATTYHQWNNPVPIYQATNPTVSAVGGVRPIYATPQRPQRNSERQTKICTETASANGFLKTRFLPKLKVNEEEIIRLQKEVTKTEKEFYQSLTQLCAYYGISAMETKHFEYPYNISLAYWDIKRKLKEKIKDSNEVHIIQTEKHQTFLSVSETYETDRYLYYVPVYSLFKMLNDKEHRQTKTLLFSVFTYLYRNIGIPFYREEDAYLFYLYEMTKDWVIEGEMYDDDKEDEEQILREMAQCEYIGDTILKKIQSKENLMRWKQRLQSFCIKNEFDNKLFDIAKEFYQLWQDYPHDSIFRYINEHEKYDEYEEGLLSMDKYLSFAFRFEGILHDQINDVVNNDLSVYSEMQEPTLHKIFNGKEIQNQNFDFEHRFFNLMDKLICLLA